MLSKRNSSARENINYAFKLKPFKIENKYFKYIDNFYLGLLYIFDKMADGIFIFLCVMITVYMPFESIIINIVVGVLLSSIILFSFRFIIHSFATIKEINKDEYETILEEKQFRVYKKKSFLQRYKEYRSKK